MHSGGVPALILAVFQLVRTLTSANLYKNRTTSVVHQPVKPKVVVSTQQQSFGMKNILSTCVCNCMLLISCMECILVVLLH